MVRVPVRAFRLAAVVLVLGVVSGACGGDGAEVSTAPTTTTDGATTTTTTAGCAVEGAAAGTSTATGSGEVALLTDVRTGRQPCADRIVFEFRGTTAPGYTVEYRPGPFTTGESGQPLDVAGRAFLVVRLEPAAGVDLASASADPTYTGPAVITPSGLTHVREVRRLSDFEGQLVWVIGLDAVQPFVVHTLEAPTRVFLDVAG